MIKKRQGFYYLTIKNVIMFTVANQKAILFSSKQDEWRVGKDIQSTYTRCVFHQILNAIRAVTIC